MAVAKHFDSEVIPPNVHLEFFKTYMEWTVNDTLKLLPEEEITDNETEVATLITPDILNNALHRIEQIKSELSNL